MGLGRIYTALSQNSLHVVLNPAQASSSPRSRRTKSLKQISNSNGMNTSNSTVKWRRCKCVSVACSARLCALTQAQVRELFTKLGVVGALLDKVVKSISSSDDTLLTFMRKVGRWPESLFVLHSSARAAVPQACWQVEFGEEEGKDRSPAVTALISCW